MLKESGRIGPTVITMSIAGHSPLPLEEMAINRAIARCIIIVTSAGNRGERGMGWPAAYPQVIGVGANGWTKQFRPGTPTMPNFAFWWTQDVGFDPDPLGPAEETEAFVKDKWVPSMIVDNGHITVGIESAARSR